MNSSYKIVFSCSLLAIVSFNTLAQNKLKDTVVVDVVKAFQPTIVDAVKLNENPIINDTTKKIPNLNYSIQSKKVNTTFDVDPIRPAKMVGEPLTKLYNTLIKAGFGNYTTPYAEIFCNNLRSKDYSYGARLKHLSSTATLKDYGFSGYSDNEVSVYGKKFLNKQTLYGDLDYSRNVIHYYGYDPLVFPVDKDSTRQRFSFINPKMQLISYYKDSSHVNHDIQFGYYNLSDSHNAVENNVRANGIFKGYLENELITVKAGIDYYNNKIPTDTVNNTLVTLNPNITSKGNKWNATIGLTTVIDFYYSNTFHFYPNIDFNYHIINNIFIPYAGVSGAKNKNSFKTLSDINPFILSNATFRNTDNKYNIYAGIRGTLEAATSFNLKATYSKINDAPFFVNNIAEPMKNKFGVIYDNFTLFNVSGEIAYQKNEKLRLLLKGDYFKYTMDKELAPWYKPEIQFTFSGNYNLKDKIVVKADFFVLGKQYAKIVTVDSSITTISKKELKGIADLNLRFEYRYTKNLSAFISFNNIGAFRYYRWNNYPTQRFNFLAGITYTF